MTIHSSTRAWGILWTEEPGRLQSMGSQELNTTDRLTLTLIYTEPVLQSTHPHVGGITQEPSLRGVLLLI